MLLAIAGPVSATDWTLTTADNIQNNITLASDGDTLILNPGTYTQNGITVTKSLTIRANTSYSGTAANTIIDGSNNQIITVNGGVTLTIDNLTLENGEVTGAGGAIINGGTLTVTSSTFTGCRARFAGGWGGTGGAIYNAGTITGITTTSFTGCTAIYGGAIYNDGGTITSITTTSFTDCTANGWGNAIYNAGTITSLTFSTFNGCSASGRHAIYNDGGTITAPDNWWGTNTPDFSDLNNGAPAPASWLVLGITASPSSITGAQTSLINVNLTWDSDGIYHNPASGHVPDGIAVLFSSTSGTFAPASGSMVSGENTTRFTPAGAGTSTINATVDLQSVIVPVMVGPSGPSITGISPAGGQVTGGDMVTITGSGFTGASAVTFGATASPGYHIDSDSQIRATAPPHAVGTVDITVTTPGGTSPAVAADQFTYTAVPITTTSSFTNGGDDAVPSFSHPSTTDTVNVGGNSAVGQVIVTGTGIAGLIVTGTVQQDLGINIPPPPGTLYQSFTIVPAQYITITGAQIFFSLPESWLADNHLSPGDITLFHYTSPQWNALPTTVLRTENGMVFFSATSPGFSPFAITGSHADTLNMSTTVSASPVPVQAINAPVTRITTLPAVGKEPDTSQTTAAPAHVSEPAPAFPLPTIVAGISGLFIIAGSGFLIRRWWIRRQNPALFREYD
jgi:hypothetical protein